MPHLRKFSRWRKPLLRESNLSLPLISLTFLPLLALVGCGESKISQCNKLITEINRGQGAYEKSTSEMKNLGKFNPSNPEELKTGYATQLDAMATGLDDSGKAMSSLGEINFKATNAFQKVEASTKQIGTSIQTVSKAGQESNRIVGEINTYCGAAN